MDNFETPYDVEVNYIECEVCKKSIRGESLFKIHLTTPTHIKREDALIAEGEVVRRQTVPKFRDIVHYLDYLKLDEPIIGLSFLTEIPPDDLEAGSNYYCNLCFMSGHLAEMVNHLIGRKHRQKYVAMTRPDLVTWDSQSATTKGGRIIRAKAEIAERQDGRGTPRVAHNMTNVGIESKSNSSRDSSRQNRDRMNPQRAENLPPLLPGLKNFRNQNKYSNTPAFHSDEPNMNRDRRRQREDTFSQGRQQDNLEREDYNKRGRYRDDFIHSDHRNQHKERYRDEPLRRPSNEGSDTPKYNYRKEIQHDQAQHAHRYPEEQSSYQRPHSKREALNEFYPEEDGRKKVRSAGYQPSKPVYPDDDQHRWSQERDSGGHDSTYRTGRQRSTEPQDKRRNLSTPVDNDHEHNHVFGIVRDYQHESAGLYQEEQYDKAGSGRPRASTSHGQVEIQALTNIPEPFRRFLTGTTNDDSHGKRRKKSRFSDATPEEIKMIKDGFSQDYGPNPNFAGDPRHVNVPSRPEMQYSDLYRESQAPHYSQSYQREGSKPERVSDLLENIEIENAEEADFLKSKLCSLLRDFKSKNMAKENQNCPSQVGMSRNYSDSMLEPQLPLQHQYERPMREDSHHCQPQDLYFRDDHRSGLKQGAHIPEDQHQEHPHPSHGELGHFHRSHYEEMFRKHGNRLDDPPYHHEGFQELSRSRDYPTAVQEFHGPPLHMGQESRMQRGPRYSNNLDKITSTLLELVSRK